MQTAEVEVNTSKPAEGALNSDASCTSHRMGLCATHPPQLHPPPHTLPRGEPPFALPPPQQRIPPQLPLLTSREELPSLLVSLYKHWLSILQKQATVLGWSMDDKLVLASVARISRVHSSSVGVHCKLPFSVQRKKPRWLGESSALWPVHAGI